jgi:hypothetical protein
VAAASLASSRPRGASNVLPREPSSPALRARRAATFVGAGALVVLLALLGGSYDLVTRQEIFLVVWWTLGVGVAVGLLVPWRHGRWPWAPLAGLALLTVWTTVSLGWTESDERTVAEIARVVGYLGLLLLVLLVVQRRTSRAAVWGAAAGAAAVCLLALVDRLTGSTLSNEAVIAQVGSSRLSYPLDYWNAMGTWAAMTLGLALTAAVHERRPALRGLALAVVPIAACTAYLTYSRTSIGSVLLAVVIVLIGSRRRWTAVVHVVVAGLASAVAIDAIHGHPAIGNGTGTTGAGAVALVIGLGAVACAAVAVGATRTGLDRVKLPREAGRLGMAVLVLVVLVGGAVGFVRAYPKIQNEFQNRTRVTANVSDPASRLTNLNGNRTRVWKSALTAFDAHPATGVGAGAFELWSNREGKDPEFVRDAHSIYLEALAELGWPGLLCVLLFAAGLLGMTIVSRVKAPPGRREAGARLGAVVVVAIFLLSAGVDWMWESTAVTALVLVIAGASGAAIARDRRGAPLSWRIGVTVLALVACLTQLPGLVSTSELRRSQAAMRAGDVDAAVADARDAQAAAPWAGTPVDQLALIAEATGEYAPAQALLLQAVRKEPWDFRPWTLLARVAAENGNLALARSAYRRAHALRPLSPLFPVPAPSANPAPARTGRR